MSSDMKLALLAGYGVESSKDLTNEELTAICDHLNGILNPEDAKLDKMRKRVIAAIGGWLRETGQKQNISIIKGIAMRASGYADFNKIPRERLRNLIATFNNKVKDARAVCELTESLMEQRRLSGGKIDPTLN